MTHRRIAVCSWSLRPAYPRELITALRRLEIRAVQLALGPLVAGRWPDAAGELRASGVRLASGMMAMVGEDYSTLQTIASTGGVRPDETWPENRKLAAEIALLAAREGIGLVTFHAGFLAPDDPRRRVMIQRLGIIADLFADAGVEVAFETGQETAETLGGVLAELDRPNVGVNFDPANMILYGTGDPVAALRVLAAHVRQVHVKDALPARRRGTWGTEVPVGRGAVDWAAFMQAALRIDPPVCFVIERESGDSREADIRTARDLVASYLPAAT